MNPCLCIVLAAGVAAAPVPATQPTNFGRLERHMQELVEQERFEELARDGETAFARVDLEPWQRRELAFYALRGYHRMFAATGEAAGLCRARNLYRRVEREVGFGDTKAVASRLRDVTESGLARQGTKDPCGVKARATANVPPASPGALLPVVQRPRPVAPPPTDASQPALLDVSRSKSPPPTTPSLRAEAAAPAGPPPPESGPADRFRRRIIAGSLLLVGGLGLGVGTAVMLVRRSQVNGEIVEIGERVDAEQRPITSAEFERVAQLADIYRNLTPVAGVTGAVASIAAVTGVVLLALPQRGRTTARVSASPWSAMLTLSGRF
ncbi:hypothetical protein [Nannocystis punicea]|uniref:Uncharacterized protein n=1 Tax=Nannocystis punicea TaxID=2995304 RepID=A0ABY7HDD0_9BACT|nr:hypothetical protein [Nannocystis poenicansa]WAS97090.1 hypothetical protein O0S08_13160 [Nannocystis poenicansa]